MRKTKTIIKKKQQKQQREQGLTTGKKSFLLLSLLGLLTIIVFVTHKMLSQAQRQDGINQEVTKLQEQIDVLNQENQDLNNLISYLKTDDFKEKEAKDKLNLIKEGEQMILVKEDGLAEQPALMDKKQETKLVVYRENYYYWWHYFFKID